MWDWLIQYGHFSPLNNVESLMFPAGAACDADGVVWNRLKGSWNLALQTLRSGALPGGTAWASPRVVAGDDGECVFAGGVSPVGARQAKFRLRRVHNTLTALGRHRILRVQAKHRVPSRNSECYGSMLMTVQVSTVGRLQSLLDLYRSGYRSPVVDQTVGKLIALEIAECRAELPCLAARLSAYEQQYHMTSDEFYRRFRNGELGDDMDLVEWSIFWDMHQATEKR